MINVKNTLFLLAIASAVLFVNSNCYANADLYNQGTENQINIQMTLKQGLPSHDVNVHVNGSVIQFAGFVDDHAQYTAVHNLANKYTDEYQVINNVKILSVKDRRRDETALRQNVISQLKDYKYPTGDIDVQVRNGHVILSGFVNKHVPLNDIKSISASVPGVTTVDNYLLYKQA